MEQDERTFKFSDGGEFDLEPVFSGVDPYSTVNIGHILTVRHEWTFAPEGPVDSRVIARMEEFAFDQAPTWGTYGIRLISIESLRQHHVSGRPLSAESDFLKNDILVLHQDQVEPDWLLDLLAQTPAVILLFPPGQPVTDQEREEHRLENEARTDSVVEGGFSLRRLPTTLRPDFHVIGLLTRADLNRKPLRRALFELLYDLEDNLARLVEWHHIEPGAWLRLLSDKRREELAGRADSGRAIGSEINPIWRATLTHLLSVAGKTPAIVASLGFDSRREFKEWATPVIELRNKIMHPVSPLLPPTDRLDALQHEVACLKGLNQRIEELRRAKRAP